MQMKFIKTKEIAGGSCLILFTKIGTGKWSLFTIVMVETNLFLRVFDASGRKSMDLVPRIEDYGPSSMD